VNPRFRLRIIIPPRDMDPHRRSGRRPVEYEHPSDTALPSLLRSDHLEKLLGGLDLPLGVEFGARPARRYDHGEPVAQRLLEDCGRAGNIVIFIQDSSTTRVLNPALGLQQLSAENGGVMPTSIGFRAAPVVRFSPPYSR
jgi:hypothetical protein